MNAIDKDKLRKLRIVQETLNRKHYRARRRQELRSTVVPIPHIQTDTTFMVGSDDGFGQDELARNVAYQKAKAAGVTPSGRYISQLADSLGDPKAWVNSRAEVKRVCEQRGYSCDGAVKVKAREPDGPNPFDEPYMVADDIVQDAVQKQLAGEQVHGQEKADLVHKTREKLSGRP